MDDDRSAGMTPQMLDRLYRSELGAIRATIKEVVREFNVRYDANAKMLDERYATQTKALDAAFAAQQIAMTTAFTSADKAVQAALTAAEKAVDKANAASEKRFEAVNEFRGQLNDIVTTLISRSEAETKFQSLTEKLDNSIGITAADRASIAGIVGAVDARLTGNISELSSRITEVQSRGVGAREAVAENRADSQHTLAYVLAGFSFMALLLTGISIYAALHH